VQGEERQGFFRRIRTSLKYKVSSTESAKQFYETNEYKEMEKLRKEMSEFRSNLKEELDST